MSQGGDSDAGRFRSPGPSPWVVVLLAFGFAPLLGTFFLHLWNQPEYQFFPQALAAAGFLAWSRSREVPRPWMSGPPAPTFVLLGISFFLLTLALVIWSPWLAAIAAMVAGVGALWWYGGWSLLRGMIPALVMCLVVIPPPLGLDARLGLFLRDAATTLSSRTLDLLGVVHCTDGNLIELPGQKLLVEEACSGIHSVLFVTAFTLFFFLWRRRAVWCFAVGIPLALACVVMGNVFRISLGAWLRYHDSIDILSGWKHETLSIILVGVYILLVVSIERLLPGQKIRPAVKTVSLPPQTAANPASGCALRYSRSGWVVGILFSLLGLLSAYQAWDKSRIAVEPLRAATSAGLPAGATFQMPDRIGEWTRLESGPPIFNKIESLGLNTLIWTYQRSGRNATVAFDFPISGYHDVEGCYKNTGWIIRSKEHVVPTTGAPPRIEVEMTKEPASHGSLWFATLNEQGQWVDEATTTRNLLGRIENLGVQRETTYRIQVLLVDKETPDAKAIQAANALFEQAAEILSRQLFQQLKK